MFWHIIGCVTVVCLATLCCVVLVGFVYCAEYINEWAAENYR